MTLFNKKNAYIAKNAQKYKIKLIHTELMKHELSF